MHRIDSRQIKAVCNKHIAEHGLSRGLRKKKKKKCAGLAYHDKLDQISM